MTKALEELGIECNDTMEFERKLNYSVTMDRNKIMDPDQINTYLEETLDTIYDDFASKKGHSLEISLDRKEYLQNLHAIATLKSYLATKQDIERKELKAHPKNWVILTCVAVGALAALETYDQFAEYAINASNYIDGISHRLAPISGSIKAGISTVSPLLLGYATSAATLALMKMGLNPYIDKKTPLANKIARYETLEKALNKAIQKEKIN